jgi:hypothetical protein
MCQPGRTQPGMQGVHTPRPATRNHVAVSGLETGSPTAKMRRSYKVSVGNRLPVKSVPPHNRSNPANKAGHWYGHPSWNVTLRGVAPTERTSSTKSQRAFSRHWGSRTLLRMRYWPEGSAPARFGKAHLTIRFGLQRGSLRRQAAGYLGVPSTRPLPVPDAGSWGEFP